jgi:hypothetical protein
VGSNVVSIRCDCGKFVPVSLVLAKICPHELQNRAVESVSLTVRRRSICDCEELLRPKDSAESLK